jgi:hypothetical protein
MLKPTSDTGVIAAITVASRHRGSTSKPTSQRGASVRYCRAPHVSVALDLQNHVEPLPLGSQVFRPGSPTSLTSQSASQHPRDLRLRAGEVVKRSGGRTQEYDTKHWTMPWSQASVRISAPTRTLPY